MWAEVNAIAVTDRKRHQAEQQAPWRVAAEKKQQQVPEAALPPATRRWVLPIAESHFASTAVDYFLDTLIAAIKVCRRPGPPPRRFLHFVSLVGHPISQPSFCSQVTLRERRHRQATSAQRAARRPPAAAGRTVARKGRRSKMPALHACTRAGVRREAARRAGACMRLREV